MTTKTRNEYIALVVILLVLGFIMYHFFFSSSSKPSPTEISTPLVEPIAGSGSATGSPTGTTSAPADTTKFLPNGATFDSAVLQSKVFTSLLPNAKFTVQAYELGIANPFVPSSVPVTSPAQTPASAQQNNTTSAPAQ